MDNDVPSRDRRRGRAVSTVLCREGGVVLRMGKYTSSIRVSCPVAVFFMIVTLPIIRSFDTRSTPFLRDILYRRLVTVGYVPWSPSRSDRDRRRVARTRARARASETSNARPNARRRRSPSFLVARRLSSRVSSSRTTVDRSRHSTARHRNHHSCACTLSARTAPR